MAIHADVLAEKLGLDVEFSTAEDVAAPMSLSTTFLTRDSGGGHIYSRDSTPTRNRAEFVLGSLEGTEEAPVEAILYSSGLAASFAILSRYLPKRVFITGGYHGVHQVISQLQRISDGSRFQKLLLPPVATAAEVLQPGDVVWIETPLNPTCEVRDIAGYVAAARQVEDVKVVVDGTFAPPPLQRPLALGADAVMHSVTKYLAGHSDALGGAVCVRDPKVAEELRKDRCEMGNTPGSMEAWLLLRSLRSVHVRVERQSASAAQLAKWLHGATPGGDPSHPLAGLVHAVHHPSLPSDPGHALARTQMPGGFGGCFALELTTEKAAFALPSKLSLFRAATSLGGVESLIEWRRRWDPAISPLLLRVSVGLEEPELLQMDLQKAILSVSKA